MSDTTGGTWDAASSPTAARIARRFEADWRRSPASARPDPDAYLPEGPEDRPGARLALLRAEMALRWEVGLQATPEYYRDRDPGLDPETLVALAYEEFCLREESGEAPDPSEFERRLPDLAEALRRVFEVHELVGGPGGPSFGSTLTKGGTRISRTERAGSGSMLAEACSSKAQAVAFPEVGETIGGFRLVEELGRGSFARVFLARERLLADRPVALKVATSGSREPQTLALLQHTHIVPVHSYRDDPLTGLHLLCMPFFGRSTLADLLDDPAVASARGGADLLEILDRIEPSPRGLPGGRTAARRALAERSIAGAFAWWGARLAEALQHAHDRGVLHRDVKPSNVLVTGDGLPMLLDFNLAQGPRVVGTSEDERAKLGGTLAYMAPEHIEALADGLDEGVDARADLFALGVVLFEAITGERPFPVVRKGRSVPEALLQTAEQRRVGPPPLRRKGRRVSSAFEAILRRCLEADPDRRYASAAELAEDLGAVADDLALRHAAEPLPSRSLRWLRRNRLRFAVAAPAAIALLTLAASLHDSRVRRIEARGEIQLAIDRAILAEQDGKLDAAVQGFEFAERAAARDDASTDLLQEAIARRKRADYRRTLEFQAAQFFEQAEELRYRLFGFVEPERPPGEVLEALLTSFNVFEEPDWASEQDFSLLPEGQRQRLLDGVPELLFLRAVHLRLTEGAAAPILDRIDLLRDRATRGMPPEDPRRAPWAAIATDADIEARPSLIPPLAGYEPSRRLAEASFLWGTYHAARFQWTGSSGDAERAIEWLEAACLERPDDYWARFYLATFALEAGRVSESLRHADSAVALRPESAWALFNRALASHANGDRHASIRDLEAASSLVRVGDRDQLLERIALNLGLVRLEVGDRQGARAALGTLLDDEPPTGARLGASFSPLVAMAAGRSVPLSSPTVFALNAASDRGRFGRAAVLNLARLDAEAGRPGRALLAYNDLLADDPGRSDARLGRALVLLSIGEASAARADLDVLVDAASVPIRTDGDRPDPEAASHAAEILELRSRSELALGRRDAAFEDAMASSILGPNPDRERLRLRTLIASGRPEALLLDDPGALDLLPAPGPGLVHDLRRAAEALEEPPNGVEPSPVPRILTVAVLRAVLGDADAAESSATEAVVLAPDAPGPRLVRGRVRLRIGDHRGALDDFNAALALDPNSMSARLARGALFANRGRAAEALADLDAARALGLDSAELHRARSQVLARLGNSPEAVAALSNALAHDPHNPLLHLVRARLHAELGRSEAALDDVNAASSWAADRLELRALAALYRAWLADGRSNRSGSVVGGDRLGPSDLRPRQRGSERVGGPLDRHPPAEDREDHVGRERRQG